MLLLLLSILAFNCQQQELKNQKAEFIENTLIMNLTYHNFDQYTLSGKGRNKWLILFYCDWCPGCNFFIPKMQQLSEIVNNQSLLQDYEQKIGLKVNDEDRKELRLAVVDSDRYPDLTHRFTIDNYPYIIYVKDGKMYQFKTSNRTTLNLFKFVFQDYLQTEEQEMPESKSIIRSVNKSRWKVFVFGCTVGFTLVIMAFSLYCAWFERDPSQMLHGYQQLETHDQDQDLLDGYQETRKNK